MTQQKALAFDGTYEVKLSDFSSVRPGDRLFFERDPQSSRLLGRIRHDGPAIPDTPLEELTDPIAEVIKSKILGTSFEITVHAKGKSPAGGRFVVAITREDDREGTDVWVAEEEGTEGPGERPAPPGGYGR